MGAIAAQQQREEYYNNYGYGPGYDGGGPYYYGGGPYWAAAIIGLTRVALAVSSNLSGLVSERSRGRRCSPEPS